MRRDRRRLTLNAVSKDLDERDRWMCIRQLRKGFSPIPYSQETKGGEHVPRSERAEHSARYLATEIWKDKRTAAERTTCHENLKRRPKIIDQNLGISEEEITSDELLYIIRKLKRRKATGPDEIPVEFIKEMTEENMREVLNILNQWWRDEELPPDTLQSRIVMIFKKGNPSDLGNYRSISLLNTMYKIFAGVIQNRLAGKLDKHLQRTQYGFRKRKRTVNAIQSIRRIIDKGESTGTKTLMVLIDWEKAFDKADQKGLLIALERMNVCGKILNLIRALYNKPQFKVTIEEKTSAWYTQETGIRQGCPL